jgi:hypothetical protein
LRTLSQIIACCSLYLSPRVTIFKFLFSVIFFTGEEDGRQQRVAHSICSCAFEHFAENR